MIQVTNVSKVYGGKKSLIMCPLRSRKVKSLPLSVRTVPAKYVAVHD